jgi:RimJ/RimL family protein N-acetyltransferase
MDIRIERADLPAISPAVEQHLESLPRPIDSFLEDHIFESTHYLIEIGGWPAGFASIHNGSLITQFCLAEPCKRWGQAAFQRLRRCESVGAAFVPTGDEFFLAHALDEYRQLRKQAYFFVFGGAPVDAAVIQGYALRQAGPDDAGFIRENSGSFVKNLETQIAAGELFVTDRDGSGVGFGVLVKSRFYPDVASIGMYTIEPHRGTGVGAATVALLIDECSRRGLRAIAGCWYYNHASKRTLERAGMVSQTRLLRIEY